MTDRHENVPKSFRSVLAWTGWLIAGSTATGSLLKHAVLALIFVVATGCAQRDPVADALKCEQLYESRKSKYWGNEIGNDKVHFNAELNTCLAMNVLNRFSSEGRYWAKVLDMGSDRILLSYSDTRGGAIVGTSGAVTLCPGRAVEYSYVDGSQTRSASGCDRDDLIKPMMERIESYGFRF